MDAKMSQEFYEKVKHLFPPEQAPGRKGGRPTVSNFTVLKALWFVFATGLRWRDVSAEVGRSGRTVDQRLREW